MLRSRGRGGWDGGEFGGLVEAVDADEEAAVEEAGEIPQAEFGVEAEVGLPAPATGGEAGEGGGGATEAVAGDAEEVGNGLARVGWVVGGGATEDALRDAAPQAPAAVVAAGEALGRDVVEDDELGDVEAVEAGGADAAVELGVFFGEEALAGAAEVGGVEADAIEDGAAEDGVAAVEVAGEGGAEDAPGAGLHDADDGGVVGRQPGGRGEVGPGKVGAANEVGDRRGSSGLGAGAGSVNSRAMISNQWGSTCSSSSMKPMRSARLCSMPALRAKEEDWRGLEEVADGRPGGIRGGFGGEGFDHCTGCCRGCCYRRQ